MLDKPVRMPAPKRDLRDWGVVPELALLPVPALSSESLIEGDPS